MPKFLRQKREHDFSVLTRERFVSVLEHHRRLERQARPTTPHLELIVQTNSQIKCALPVTNHTKLSGSKRRLENPRYLQFLGQD